MKRLFSVDGPFMAVLRHISNHMILSLLWIVCCLPVITIGASTSALYYVTLKMARGEAPGAAAPFFRALKENLRSGSFFSLLFGAAGAVLYFDYAVMFRQAGALGTVSRVCFLTLGFLCLITMLYTFPLQAQFVNSIRGTLKNAFFFSIRNIRVTLVVLAIHAAPFLAVLLPFRTLLQILPVLVLLLPALIAHLCSVQLMKVFRPFMGNTET